jgi:hypothetical protein
LIDLLVGGGRAGGTGRRAARRASAHAPTRSGIVSTAVAMPTVFAGVVNLLAH